MHRLIAGIVLLTFLVACSESAPAEPNKDDRCVSAKRITAEVDAYGKALKAQTPDAKVDDFYVELARGKVDSDALGLVDSQQKSLQVVSDNPRCFGVARVADARRMLKVIDPAMLKATKLLASAQTN